jgi:hypothetical protein
MYVPCVGNLQEEPSSLYLLMREGLVRRRGGGALSPDTPTSTTSPGWREGLLGRGGGRPDTPTRGRLVVQEASRELQLKNHILVIPTQTMVNTVILLLINRSPFSFLACLWSCLVCRLGSLKSWYVFSTQCCCYGHYMVKNSDQSQFL